MVFANTKEAESGSSEGKRNDIDGNSRVLLCELLRTIFLLFDLCLCLVLFVLSFSLQLVLFLLEFMLLLVGPLLGSLSCRFLLLVFNLDTLRLRLRLYWLVPKVVGNNIDAVIDVDQVVYWLCVDDLIDGRGTPGMSISPRLESNSTLQLTPRVC